MKRLAALLALLATEAQASWLDIFRKKDPEPEPAAEMTVLGMDPLTLVIVCIVILGAGLAIYSRPRTFLRGLTESLGWVAGILLTGALAVGFGALYLESLGAALMIGVIVVVGLVLFFLFVHGGGEL